MSNTTANWKNSNRTRIVVTASDEMEAQMAAENFANKNGVGVRLPGWEVNETTWEFEVSED